MAAGDTLLIFTPHQNDPPASNYATFDTRNGILVLDFDDTTAEAAVFRGIMPRHYTGRGVTVYVHYCCTSATSNTAGWDIAFARLGDGIQNLGTFTYATAQTITAVTVPSGTAGITDIVSVNISDGSNMNSVAAGESFLLRIRRDTANDNAAGDLELIAIEIREQ